MSFQASVGTFVGDSGSGGQSGLVPAPSVGDSSKVLKGSGVWGAVAGGGSKNYLAVYTASLASGTANTGNGDFELNATTGWSKGNVALTSNFPSGVPTFGSGSSANLSISIVSSSQLAGSYSLSYASSAATVAGDFVASDAFYIDAEDQAKVLTFKFYYKAQTNPSNANWSGTSSNSFGVAIYDVTGAAWIMPAGVWGMTQSSGIGYCTGTFQTTSSGSQYRIAVFNANATSGAVTLYLDDFSVGPQTAPMGPAMDDWVAYTPTFVGLGTVSNVNMFSRRNGDSLEVRGYFQAGTVTGTTASMTLGYKGTSANVSTDTTKAASGGLVGSGATNSTAATTYFGLIGVLSTSGTTVNFGIQSSTLTAMATATGSQLVNNSANIDVYFKVPITGWSSNVQMSSDTDTRVVAMQVNGTPTATITGSDSLLKFTTTPTQDTHGAFSTSTGLYTVPVTGFYRVTANLDFTGSFTIDQGINISIRKNGTAINQNGWVSFGTTGAGYIALTNVTATIYCNAGDTLAPGVSGSGSSLSVTTSTLFNYFNVERLSGPAVVAATESINMRYHGSSTAIVSNNSPIFLNFASRDFDSHLAWGSTQYTAPVAGKYTFALQAEYSGFSSGSAFSSYLTLYKNGATLVSYHNTYPSGVNDVWTNRATDFISLNASDTIGFAVIQNTGTTQAIGNVQNTFLSIARIGN